MTEGEVRRLERAAEHLVSPVLIGREPLSDECLKINQSKGISTFALQPGARSSNLPQVSSKDVKLPIIMINRVYVCKLDKYTKTTTGSAV